MGEVYYVIRVDWRERRGVELVPRELTVRRFFVEMCRNDRYFLLLRREQQFLRLEWIYYFGVLVVPTKCKLS